MATHERLTVLIVDDHPMMRLGIAAIVNDQPDMTVVAQAGTGEQAVELWRQHKPHVTLMDLRLPGMSGVEAIRAIRRECPRSRVVVLTTYEGDEDVHQALEAGAQGYLLKGMSPEVLLDAIRRVDAGNRVLPPPIARSLDSRAPCSDLSAREREVLVLIAQGRNNKEIGAALRITEGTVKCHVTMILSRLGVSDRTQAVVAAIQRGIVHIP
jgi:DNA-binding NarL/FixJ family response regulator